MQFALMCRADVNGSGHAGDHALIANQMMATTIALHTTGVTRFELPLRGEPAKSQSRYRKTARTLSRSDAFSRSPSGFDGAGCATLTGSDAGKLSIKPVSSLW
jgi:hypothetical protein